MLQYAMSRGQCPHCNSTSITSEDMKFNKDKLTYYYKCNECNKKFIEGYDITYAITWYEAPLKHEYVRLLSHADKYQWCFSMDLRHLFEDDELEYGNGTIENIIEKKLNRTKLKGQFVLDSESACFYIYFKTEKDGHHFIDWMNKHYK